MRSYRLFSVFLLLGVLLAGLTAGATRIQAATPKISLILPADPSTDGTSINVLLDISDAANLGAWEFDLVYDPTFVTVTGMTIDPAFGAEINCNAQTQRCAVALGPVTDTPGTANLGAVTYGKAAGLNGSATLAVIHLKATGKIGETPLTLTNALVTDVNAQATTPTVQGGTLVLSEPANRIYLPSVNR
ncbi:hypothetical protein GC175_32680 [bacterium]|nr:hypothetical protein [bacterium]